MAKLERKPRRNIQYKDMGMRPLSLRIEPRSELDANAGIQQMPSCTTTTSNFWRT